MLKCVYEGQERYDMFLQNFENNEIFIDEREKVQKLFFFKEKENE